MLQVARLAPNLLAEATPRVVDFLEDQLADDGGALDRAGKSDLYYTAFLLDALIALQAEMPSDRVRGYLEGFGAGEELDLVHRACLVRCHRALCEGGEMPAVARDAVAGVEELRSGDGGYASRPKSEIGTLYDAFLVLGMYQDLGAMPPDPDALADSVETLRTGDGAYANALDLPLGTTPSTAAAAVVLRHLDRSVPDEIGPWLLAQRHPQGGFKATPDAPMPDLLSTATALHALASVELDVGEGREPTLDFVDSLWSGRAFYGTWDDDTLDCEYAFYALLALGHLSLEP